MADTAPFPSSPALLSQPSKGAESGRAQRILLPPACLLQPCHLTQLRAQIHAYKLLKLRLPLATDLLKLVQDVGPEDQAAFQTELQLALAQVAAYRKLDAVQPCVPLRVPGSLERRELPYYQALRRLDPTCPERERCLLGLTERQEQMRGTLLDQLRGKLSADYLEAGLLDRSCLRRPANSARAKQDQRVAVRYEQAMRCGSELRKRQLQQDLMSELGSFYKDFSEFHRKKYGAAKKTAIGTKAKAEYLEKQDQLVRDRMEKERIKRLKDDDFGGYIELVNSAKNNRLLDILNQTDSFLRELGAKVLLQKGEAAQTDSADASQDLSGRLKFSSQQYYRLTHSMAEEVREQPVGVEGGVLKHYQIVGLQWLVSLYNNNLHGILADEMGLGKTIQTIALLQYIIEKKKNYGPFLIVVPLSTLSNWVFEFTKWTPSIRKVIYRGPPASRKRIIHTLKARKFNVLISTYEYIMKDKHMLNKFHWSYIIVDEGHRMKNAKSKFAQILGQQYQSDHRLLLTGTPLQNNLAELWALLNFLLPKIFHSLDDFEKWFNQPLASIGEKSTALSEEETLLIINRLHQVLRPFLLRRVKKEVESELPDKVENVLKVDLSSWQRALYDKIHARTYIGSGRIKNLNNSVMQLRKVCNHPYLFYPECRFPVNDELWRCSGKFELLDRMLPKLIKGGHQCLIFFQMTQVMDIMEKYFEYRHFVYLRLDGSTKSEERERRMGLFNAPNSEFPIFLLSTRAGGLGLNLQAADTVILFDSDWNPMMDLQAQDRAHRIGQKREVRVYRLVTNTKIEETILTRASVKKKLDGQVIQAGLFNNNATDKERQDKLRIFLKRDEESEEDEQAVMEDEEVNELLSRDDQEFELFESMDRTRKQTERFESRLIRDSRLPDWITEDEKEDQPVPRSYGRGSRVHKKVSYAEEFQSCESSESEPSPRKHKRTTKIKISATGVTSSSQSEQPEETEELVIEDSWDSN